VEEFLLSRITFGSKDELILEAIRHIQDCKGNIKMSELISRLFISRSPIEKRFRKIVGTSPKKFASLVRFNDILTSYRPNQSLTEVAHGAGIYEQSHFIKQFKTYTGDTPEIFFSTPK
jgi:methylphosphotriester-DNA--protein-cysteine methyltransferase